MQKNIAEYKAAIVGCGGIAQVHMQALQSLPGVRLTACADIRPERARAMADRCGARAYESLEALLAAEKIDVLHICTPHSLHSAMARQAAEREIAVFSEKPPAINREQWAEFSAITNVPVGICFQNRYNRSVQYLRELLLSGQAGEILGARAFVTWRREAPYYTESGWRGALATEGGGVLMNQSIHTMDLLVYLIGKPLSCEASCGNRHLKDVIEVEDTLEAYIDFGKAKALFYATTAYSQDAPVLLELHCANMTLRMEEERVTVLCADKTRKEIQFAQAAPAGKAYWGNSHHACIGDFYDCLRAGRAPAIGLPQVADTVGLVLDCYEKARGC